MVDMGEYYVLMEDQNIVSIFHSLMDALSWKPPRKLSDPLVIHKIREDNGTFITQKIQVSPLIYNIRL
jgi:hypothetical protein